METDYLCSGRNGDFFTTKIKYVDMIIPEV